MARPNIILINCDDLGYGDLGCYGSQMHQTPALDRMAAEGMKFTDFYMAAAVCSPSRGAMMTGCYPPRIGFGNFDNLAWKQRGVLFPGDPVGLNPNEITIAKILQGEGYATKLIGKWHCGDQPEFLPTNHGFDSYYGLPYSNDMGREERPDRPMLPPLPLMRDTEVIQEQPDQASLTERYAEEAVRFMREKQQQPFFLYFAHMHVHWPIFTPPHFLRNSQNGRYGAAVAAIDWSVAVILDELKELGLDDHTLVIFTSDNGTWISDRECGSNAPLRGGKGSTWEGGIRLPCIMRWPGKIPAGTVCAEIATAMDFLPTLAKFANAPIPQDRVIDGKDISPLALGESGAKSPHEAFFYYQRNNLTSVRSGDWKLWFGEKELYNLKDDIGESNNVFDQHPEVVERLEKLGAACREDLGDEKTGTKGKNCRPLGKIDNPKPLTEYDPSHPYIVAMYDVDD